MDGSNKTPIKSLDSLTSLRFLAAFVVFIYHSQFLANNLNRFHFGEIGVGFFFLLSGFIMSYVYFQKLRKGNSHEVVKFYVARIAKLYPLHILTFLISLPLVFSAYGVIIGGPTNWNLVGAAISNLTLTQAYSSNIETLYSYNGVTWSISVEMLFYLLFPLIILFIGKRYQVLNKNNLRLSMAILLTAMVLINIFVPIAFVNSPLYRLSEFAIGTLAGIFFLKYGSKAGKSKKINPTVLEIIAVVAFAVSLGSFQYAILPKGVTIVTYILPATIFLIYTFALQAGAISKFISNKAFVFLGNISFSFYMIHMLVLRYMNGIGSIRSTFYSLIITLFASAALYLLFEEPARKFVKSKLDGLVDGNWNNSGLKRYASMLLARLSFAKDRDI